MQLVVRDKSVYLYVRLLATGCAIESLSGNVQCPLPVFSESIESQHLRLDPSTYENVYIVGDVHGCLGELTELLESLSVTDEDLVVFVGDLVRKGPDSRGVTELVRNSPNMYSVRRK